MAELTANALKLLLTRLDAADPTIAGEKYQLLVLKITKYFIWQGSPESIADNLAESAIDRLAEKLEQGVVIENLNAYVHQIARFVWLEHERRHRETQWTDDVPEPAVEPQTVQSDDIRLDCLRKCLTQISDKDERERTLILNYYDAEHLQKNKDKRKKLAEEFGISMNLLKVRACRIRLRLEKCVKECVA